MELEPANENTSLKTSSFCLELINDDVHLVQIYHIFMLLKNYMSAVYSLTMAETKARFEILSNEDFFDDKEKKSYFLRKMVEVLNNGHVYLALINDPEKIQPHFLNILVRDKSFKFENEDAKKKYCDEVLAPLHGEFNRSLQQFGQCMFNFHQEKEQLRDFLTLFQEKFKQTLFEDLKNNYQIVLDLIMSTSMC